MQATRQLWKHTPMIKFIGKRGPPKNIDHTPRVHPSSPAKSLPDTFSSYRQSAQQYGPMAGKGSTSSSASRTTTSTSAPSTSSSSSSSSSSSPTLQGRKGGLLSTRSGKSLGSVSPKEGEFFDRDELPERFRRMAWSGRDIEAVESGGASLW